MSKISLSGNASGTGTFTLASPNSSTDRTLTLPDATGTINTSGAVNEVPAGSAAAPAIYPTGDNNTGIFFPAADVTAIATGGTERVRTTSSGYFKASNSGDYLGPTSAYHEFRNNANNQTLYIQNTNASFTSAVLEFGGTRTTTNATYYLLDSYNGNVSGRFRVTDGGNCQNTNSSYGGTSDIRLKQDVIDASSQWDDIKNLRVRKYRFKNNPESYLQIGVIAQELEEVSPGLIEESVDRDREGNDLGTTTKSVKYSILYMKAVKALQEAMERIETLEAKVAALEANT
jgi:hypothetical protein